MQKYTIRNFNEDFPNDDACLQSIVDMLYPEGIVCRKCEQVRPHAKLTNRKAYSCDYCGTHVYPLAGSIFEKSSTPLKSWFYAMYLMAQTRCGISAKQLERELGVTYKTAWRMFKQIRSLLAEDLTLEGSSVEVDESYFGGKEANRHAIKRTPGTRGRGSAGKTVVAGAVERKGRVIAVVVPDVKTKTMIPFIESNVRQLSTVYTDELKTYQSVGNRGYQHKRVQHGAGVYVDGDAHTNTIEGFWSLTKNGIRGVYHNVSAKYLQTYLNEYSFRYNHRDDAQAMFATVGNRVREVRAGRYGDYQPLG